MMLASRKFAECFSRPFRINREYELPYVAGYSKDGSTIYIDRHVDTMMGNVDTKDFLVLHEHTEKTLITAFGLNYQQAHHIASDVEHNAVVKAGIKYADYDKHYKAYIKDLAHETMRNSPPDLDITPYLDERDFRELASDPNFRR